MRDALLACACVWAGNSSTGACQTPTVTPCHVLFGAAEGSLSARASLWGSPYVPGFIHTPEPSCTTASAWSHSWYFSGLCSSSPRLSVLCSTTSLLIHTCQFLSSPLLVLSSPAARDHLPHLTSVCHAELHHEPPQPPLLCYKFIYGNSSSGEGRWSLSQRCGDLTSPSSTWPVKPLMAWFTQ